MPSGVLPYGTTNYIVTESSDYYPGTESIHVAFPIGPYVLPDPPQVIIPSIDYTTALEPMTSFIAADTRFASVACSLDSFLASNNTFLGTPSVFTDKTMCNAWDFIINSKPALKKIARDQVVSLSVNNGGDTCLGIHPLYVCGSSTGWPVTVARSTFAVLKTMGLMEYYKDLPAVPTHKDVKTILESVLSLEQTNQDIPISIRGDNTTSSRKKRLAGFAALGLGIANRIDIELIRSQVSANTNAIVNIAEGLAIVSETVEYLSQDLYSELSKVRDDLVSTIEWAEHNFRNIEDRIKQLWSSQQALIMEIEVSSTLSTIQYQVALRNQYDKALQQYALQLRSAIIASKNGDVPWDLVDLDRLWETLQSTAVQVKIARSGSETPFRMTSSGKKIIPGASSSVQISMNKVFLIIKLPVINIGRRMRSYVHTCIESQTVAYNTESGVNQELMITMQCDKRRSTMIALSNDNKRYQHIDPNPDTCYIDDITMCTGHSVEVPVSSLSTSLEDCKVHAVASYVLGNNTYKYPDECLQHWVGKPPKLDSAIIPSGHIAVSIPPGGAVKRCSPYTDNVALDAVPLSVIDLPPTCIIEHSTAIIRGSKSYSGIIFATGSFISSVSNITSDIESIIKTGLPYSAALTQSRAITHVPYPDTFITKLSVETGGEFIIRKKPQIDQITEALTISYNLASDAKDIADKNKNSIDTSAADTSARTLSIVAISLVAIMSVAIGIITISIIVLCNKMRSIIAYNASANAIQRQTSKLYSN